MSKKMNEKSLDEKKTASSLLSLKTYLSKLKSFFKLWISIAIIAAVICSGGLFVKNIITTEVSTTINFSFDGIESGLAPDGNKFEINEIKSVELVSKTLEDLGLTNIDAENLAQCIKIEGIVPADVIDRIIEYTPRFSSEEKESIESSQNIQDTSYYPTQYMLKLECSDTELNNEQSAEFLNKLCENYNTYFYSTYGYNTSLESAVISIDYESYDYVDAVDVFASSLSSLRNYITELERDDNTRFRSKEGYTFADLSASIDAIRTEDLDWISSYILLNNVSKDSETLIANYQYRIENLKRSKIISSETVDAIAATLEIYEKNSILLFANATDGTNATLNQSNDTYDNLISQKINAETRLTECDQKIKIYEERIKALELGETKESDIEIVENELAKISDKINNLLSIANATASEFYEDVLFYNAYTILRPASSSIFTVLKNSIFDNLGLIISLESLILAAYMILALISCFTNIKCPALIKSKFTKKNNKQKNIKNNK